jgi:hypothetical protein
MKDRRVGVAATGAALFCLRGLLDLRCFFMVAPANALSVLLTQSMIQTHLTFQ